MVHCRMPGCIHDRHLYRFCRLAKLGHVGLLQWICSCQQLSALHLRWFIWLILVLIANKVAMHAW